MEKLIEEINWYKQTIQTEFNTPMRLTKDDKQNFKTADECHICNKKYVEKCIHVRDHCLITRKYRGSAHISTVI